MRAVRQRGNGRSTLAAGTSTLSALRPEVGRGREQAAATNGTAGGLDGMTDLAVDD